MKLHRMSNSLILRLLIASLTMFFASCAADPKQGAIKMANGQLLPLKYEDALRALPANGERIISATVIPGGMQIITDSTQSMTGKLGPLKVRKSFITYRFKNGKAVGTPTHDIIVKPLP